MAVLSSIIMFFALLPLGAVGATVAAVLVLIAAALGEFIAQSVLTVRSSQS